MYLLEAFFPFTRLSVSSNKRNPSNGDLFCKLSNFSCFTREIVAAAHLQSITRKDVKKKQYSWNVVAKGHHSEQE